MYLQSKKALQIHPDKLCSLLSQGTLQEKNYFDYMRRG